MSMRGSGCAVFDTTTMSRPVSGVARVAGSTVTSNVGACATSAVAKTETAQAARVKRLNVRVTMAGLGCGVNDQEAYFITLLAARSYHDVWWSPLQSSPARGRRHMSFRAATVCHPERQPSVIPGVRQGSWLD